MSLLLILLLVRVPACTLSDGCDLSADRWTGELLLERGRAAARQSNVGGRNCLEERREGEHVW